MKFRACNDSGFWYNKNNFFRMRGCNMLQQPLQFIEAPVTEKTIRVLAIGNSFSVDATTYLRDMALADGIDLRVMNHAIGGCSLQRHHGNMTNGTADYSTTYYTPDVVYTAKPTTLEQGVTAHKWDYITIQQVSGLSGKYDTFTPYYPELVAYIKERQPEAEIMLHMTWAYAEGFSGLQNHSYEGQDHMYRRIVETYARFSKDLDGARILPSGEAIQRARATEMGDVFNRDGFHCNVKGRIIAGWVWYEIFTGISPFDCKFDPKSADKFLTDHEIELMKTAAHEAVLAYQK